MHLNGRQAGTIGEVLVLFLDTAPGGQNPLSGVSGALSELDGLQFDVGFAADYAFDFAGARSTHRRRSGRISRHCPPGVAESQCTLAKGLPVGPERFREAPTLTAFSRPSTTTAPRV
jgi:hypothetical protein